VQNEDGMEKSQKGRGLGPTREDGDWGLGKGFNGVPVAQDRQRGGSEKKWVKGERKIKPAVAPLSGRGRKIPFTTLIAFSTFEKGKVHCPTLQGEERKVGRHRWRRSRLGWRKLGGRGQILEREGEVMLAPLEKQS